MLHMALFYEVSLSVGERLPEGSDCITPCVGRVSVVVSDEASFLLCWAMLIKVFANALDGNI